MADEISPEWKRKCKEVQAWIRSLPVDMHGAIHIDPVKERRPRVTIFQTYKNQGEQKK